ncbi:CBS domain-containing protein [Rhodobacteraceae bacterium NNCM2]|nr:CBS domain-containing protein [Coraliihabitans acroporae]
MNVMQILNLKGSRSVETVAPTITVAEAAKQLSAKKIGALVVSEDGRNVAGIISERDIVRVLGRDGISVMKDPVSKLMTAKVEGCKPDDSAMSVLERMTEGRFRHMPVIDQGEMIGFLSIGDVVKARIAEIESDNAAMVEMLHG